MRTGASTHYADAFDKQIKTEATLFRVKDSETDTSYDTVAYISIGQAYGLISLSSARGFSYTDYETYHRQKNAYETALAQYNSDVASYNADFDAYGSLLKSCGGYVTAGKCQGLMQWYDDLERQRAQLDSRLAQLEAQKATLCNHTEVG